LPTVQTPEFTCQDLPRKHVRKRKRLSFEAIAHTVPSVLHRVSISAPFELSALPHRPKPKMAPQKKAKAETIYGDLGVAELIMSPVGLIVAAALRCGTCP